MIKIKKDKLASYIIGFYITLLYVGGEVISGVLYADLLLPLMLWLMLKNLKEIDKRLLFISTPLLIYTIVAACISVALDYNSIFMAGALVLRTCSFVLLIFIGQMFWHIFHKISIHAFFIPLLGAVIITYINYVSGQRAYYGYGQIVSTNAPAISGFCLGIASLYFFLHTLYISSNGKSNKVVPIMYSFVFFVIVLSTFSLAGTIATIGSIGGTIGMLLVLKNRQIGMLPLRKIMIIISMLIIFLLVAVYANELLDVFWRITRVFDKLDYRSDKVMKISNELCEGVLCKLFGIGPGAHSSHNNGILGETSILTFDQLYGRIFLEWGIVGSVLWLLFSASLIIIIAGRSLLFYQPMIAVAVYGLAFGIGSEFIFVSYSGSIFALIVGAFYGAACVIKSKPLNRNGAFQVFY